MQQRQHEQPERDCNDKKYNKLVNITKKKRNRILGIKNKLVVISGGEGPHGGRETGYKTVSRMYCTT